MINFLYSFIRFIIAAFFILLGILGVLIPWFPAISAAVIQFILDESLVLSLFGLGFILIGLTIITHILIHSQRRYYRVHSDQPVLVSQSALEQYVHAYWKQLFPDREIPSRLTLKKNKINITADFPYLPVDQQQKLLDQIKHDLSLHFKQLLGSESEFILLASFQPKPKKV